MGNKASSSGLANALFSSVQQRVLGLLLGFPDRDFSTSEIIRRAKSGTGAVQRELARLASRGILTIKRVGNQKRYQANPSSPIYEDLRRLIMKTVGLAEPIRQALLPFEHKVQTAFIYGSVARGEDRSESDVDLFVLGEGVSYGELFDALKPVEAEIGRAINPSLMTRSEWQQKLADKNSFIVRVDKSPKIFVTGPADGFGSPE
jgi:predicted nucleotidyltransferase